jgi:hypothetical protein
MVCVNELCPTGSWKCRIQDLRRKPSSIQLRGKDMVIIHPCYILVHDSRWTFPKHIIEGEKAAKVSLKSKYLKGKKCHKKK